MTTADPIIVPTPRRELLTHSRADCFKTCRRKHEYAYEIGLRPETDAKALRMGSAFHAGVERLGDCDPENLPSACKAVRAAYADMPDHFDPYWWAVELETILSLVCAYQWRWANHKLDVIATEQAFRVPLVNPATGKATPTFDLAGKIDGIVRLEDGRLAVKETKTCSEDLAPGSDYWRRLRIDHQITLYTLAARQLGHDVSTVLYDVVRKPAIQPTPVPLTDTDGVKIVLDATGNRVKTKDGKKWRETTSAADGYALQTRTCTVEEWGERLRADVAERPDFYFARVEIPRLDQDVEAFRAELWDLQHQIRQAQLDGLHYRTVSRNTCPYCPYFAVCSTNQTIDPDAPPAGFVVLSDVHPELSEDHEQHASTPARFPAEPAAGYPTSPAAAGQTVG
jgi:hypothetical protein